MNCFPGSQKDWRWTAISTTKLLSFLNCGYPREMLYDLASMSNLLLATNSATYISLLCESPSTWWRLEDLHERADMTKLRSRSSRASRVRVLTAGKCGSALSEKATSQIVHIDSQVSAVDPGVAQTMCNVAFSPTHTLSSCGIFSPSTVCISASCTYACHSCITTFPCRSHTQDISRLPSG